MFIAGSINATTSRTPVSRQAGNPDAASLFVWRAEGRSGMMAGPPGTMDPVSRAHAAVDGRPVSPWLMLGLLAAGEFLGMTLWFSATAVTPALVAEVHLSTGQAAWLTMALGSAH